MSAKFEPQIEKKLKALMKKRWGDMAIEEVQYVKKHVCTTCVWFSKYGAGGGGSIGQSLTNGTCEYMSRTRTARLCSPGWECVKQGKYTKKDGRKGKKNEIKTN